MGSTRRIRRRRPGGERPERPAASSGASTGALAALVVVLVVVAAVSAIAGLPVLARRTPDAWLGLGLLVGLGWWSGRVKAREADSQIDLSFTAVALLGAAVFGGPTAAVVVGTLVSLAAPGRLVRIVNAAMFAAVGGVAAWTYRAAGGVGIDLLVRTDLTDPGAGYGVGVLVRLVAWPLVLADVALIVGNAAVLAALFRSTGDSARTVLTGPFARNVVLYLGYSLTTFAFVVLWGPAGVGPLAVALIMAPLLVARWAYGQDIAERASRWRILDALGAAGHGRDASPRRRGRLRALAGVVADELSLPPRVRSSLMRAVDLHDIGAPAIPRDEAGSRTWRAAVRGHPVAGWEVLRRLDFLGDVPLAVRHHHERMDGRGYPDGLAGDEIPLPARILAVVDAYEAAAWPDADDRPGRHDGARAALRGAAGTHLDPRLVAALERGLHARGPSAWAAWLDAAGYDEGGTTPRSVAVARDGDVLLDPAAVLSRHAATTVSVALARPGVRRRAPAEPTEQGGQTEPTDQVPQTDQVGQTRASRGPGAGPGGLANAAEGGGVGASGRRPRWGARRDGIGSLAAVLIGAALLALAAWGCTPGLQTGHRLLLAVYGGTLVVAERFRLATPAGVPIGYAAGAVALGLALTSGVAGHAHVASLAEVLLLTAAAAGVDLLRRARPGHRESRSSGGAGVGVYVADAAVRWVATAGVAATVRLVDPATGHRLIDEFARRPGWWTALVATAVVAVAYFVEGLLRSAWTARARHIDLLESIRLSAQGYASMGTATAATGVVIGLAQPVVGLVALPLVVAPLVVAQLAVRRQALMLRTHAQSLEALSRLPEVLGVVGAGHAQGVAALAQRAGRRLGLGGRALDRLRSAALLHDVGQAALSRPIPGGATVLAAPADQERIARMSADVARRAGVDDATAVVVEQQAVPYHEVVRDRRRLGIEARILKAANAFDDHRRTHEGPRRTGTPHRGPSGAAPEVDDADADAAQAREAALERLYLGYGHEFDPRVVDALAHVVHGRTATVVEEPGRAGGSGRRDRALRRTQARSA